MNAHIVFLLFMVLFTGDALANKDEPRLALIITNEAYQAEIGGLDASHANGALLATALKGVGFSNVRHVKEATFQTMQSEVAGFVDRVRRAGPDAVVFFYYSGHGISDRVVDGENYLIPIGTRVRTTKQLPSLGYKLSNIVNALVRVPAKARFAVIDASREVAFNKERGDAAKGMSTMQRTDDVLLAFSAQPGRTAESNSAYSRNLAKNVQRPNVLSQQVFQLTQAEVAEKSKGAQIPWIEDGLRVRNFAFKTSTQVSETATSSNENQLQRKADKASSTDLVFRIPELGISVKEHGRSLMVTSVDHFYFDSQERPKPNPNDKLIATGDKILRAGWSSLGGLHVNALKAAVAKAKSQGGSVQLMISPRSMRPTLNNINQINPLRNVKGVKLRILKTDQ